LCTVSLGASFYIMYKINKNPADTLKYSNYIWLTVIANFYGGYTMLTAQKLQTSLAEKYLGNVTDEGLKQLAEGKPFS